MDLLIRRVFGRSSEKLDASQLDLFLMAPENEPGKVDASSLEEADPRHEPRGRARRPSPGAMACGFARSLRRSSIPRKCRRLRRIGA